MNLQSLKKRDLKAAKKVKERVSNFDLGSVFTKRVMNDYNHIKHRYTSMELREYSSEHYLKKIDEITPDVAISYMTTAAQVGIHLDSADTSHVKFMVKMM